MITDKTIVISHNWSQDSVNAQSVALAFELSKKNKVIFISQTRLDNSYTEINTNLSVYEWPNKKPRTLKDFLFYYRLVKKNKPHVSIVHFGAHNVVAIAGWLAGVKARINYYHTLTEQIALDFKKSKSRFYFERLRKWFVLKFDTHIIAVSNYAATDMVKYYSFKPNKVFTIYNALPEINITNNASPESPIRFVGRFDNCKGADILIDAISIVIKKYPFIKVEMAGGGSYELFTQRIQKLGLDKNIQIVGPIPYKEILAFISGSYTLVVPSKIDNLPTVIIEGFATATPVIAANTGGIPEMITDKKNGLLFEKNNAADLAEKIVLLLKNAELRTQLSDQAKYTYNNRYRFKHYNDAVNNLLTQLITQ